MRESVTIGMERHGYGDTTLWSIHDTISGGGARRLGELVGLFFRDAGGKLLIDLREAGFIDHAGAAALAGGCASHPPLRLVGFPPVWDDLALEVRIALLKLGPARNLMEALGGAGVPAAHELRRHTRIPLQIPVELCFGGRAAIVALRDVSRGGLRFAGIPAAWLPELGRSGTAPSFEVLGLETDPLGREIVGRGGDRALPAVPVHFLPGLGIGARFLESHPPV